MWWKSCTAVLLILQLSSTTIQAQEFEFSKLVKDLLQGDELKNIQSKKSTTCWPSVSEKYITVIFERFHNIINISTTDMYSALPVELRDKLTKDLLANPGKVGKDLVNMFGPQVQNMIAGFAGNLGKSKNF
jgi:hypothetical protein